MNDYDFYRLFKLLHILSVMALGGGFVLEAICGPLVAKAKTVGEVRAFARLMFISENYLSIPAAILIAGFGYATAGRAHIDMDVTWLAIGQALFYIIVVLAIAFLRPAANRLHKLAQAAPDGPVTPEITAQLQKPLAMIVGITTSVMFVCIAYLMVVKPAW